MSYSYGKNSPLRAYAGNHPETGQLSAKIGGVSDLRGSGLAFVWRAQNCINRSEPKKPRIRPSHLLPTFYHPSQTLTEAPA